MLENLEKIEQIILQFIYDLHTPLLDKIMAFITNLGNYGEIWIAVGVILLIPKKHRKVGFLVLLSLLLMKIINDFTLKNLIARVRPFNFMDVNVPLKELPDSYSFPSGHTSSAFAAAFILFKFYRKYAILIFSGAGLMAFTRLYLTVHYPTDIIAGIFIGYLCSVLAVVIFDKTTGYINKRKAKAAQFDQAA